MSINLNSNRELPKVFQQFEDSETNGFTKTVIPVKLMKYEGMELLS